MLAPCSNSRGGSVPVSPAVHSGALKPPSVTDLRKGLSGWLAAQGVEGERRVVRTSASSILVSKFEEGFAARLHDAIDRIPELFDEDIISQNYWFAAPGTPRVEAWRLAVAAVLAELGPARRLDRDQLAEIQAGVDSVAALLDSVLWTVPTISAPWSPSEAERIAYREARTRMDDESSIFTRYYGDFEGHRVENHCPGAQVARRLFAQAWTLVTAPPDT